MRLQKELSQLTGLRALKIIIPFSYCYFLGILLRNSAALFAEPLTSDMQFSAGEIGFALSPFLVSFALFAAPLGALMDRYDPKRVQAWLLLITLLGVGIYGASHHLFGMTVGRLLMGFGGAIALYAGLRSFYFWFPENAFFTLNSCLQVAGGLGALFASYPLAFLMKGITWRGASLVLGGLVLIGIALMLFVTPIEKRDRVQTSFSLKEVFNYREIIQRKLYWKLMIPSAVCFGGFVAIQSLWIGPFLKGGLGFSMEKTALYMLATSIGMIAGILANSFLVRFGHRHHLSIRITQLFLFVLYAVFLLLISIEPFATHVITWVGFGFFAQALYMIFPMLFKIFPHELFGKVIGLSAILIMGSAYLLQLLMGVIITLFPQMTDGYYQERAYQYAYWFVFILTGISLLFGGIHKKKALYGSK